MNFELVPGQEVNQTYPDTSLEMFLNFLLLKKMENNSFGEQYT